MPQSGTLRPLGSFLVTFLCPLLFSLVVAAAGTILFSDMELAARHRCRCKDVSQPSAQPF